MTQAVHVTAAQQVKSRSRREFDRAIAIGIAMEKRFSFDSEGGFFLMRQRPPGTVGTDVRTGHMGH